MDDQQAAFDGRMKKAQEDLNTLIDEGVATGMLVQVDKSWRDFGLAGDQPEEEEEGEEQQEQAEEDNEDEAEEDEIELHEEEEEEEGEGRSSGGAVSSQPLGSSSHKNSRRSRGIITAWRLTYIPSTVGSVSPGAGRW